MPLLSKDGEELALYSPRKLLKSSSHAGNTLFLEMQKPILLSKLSSQASKTLFLAILKTDTFVKIELPCRLKDMNFTTPKPSKHGEDFASLSQASRTINQSMLTPSEYGEELDLSLSQASMHNCKFRTCRACSEKALEERSDAIVMERDKPESSPSLDGLGVGRLTVSSSVLDLGSSILTPSDPGTQAIGSWA